MTERFPRHSMYTTGYHSLERQLRGGRADKLKTIKVALPALTAIPKAYETYGKGQNLRSEEDPTSESWFSGVPLKVGDLCGIIYRDVVGDNAGGQEVTLLIETESSHGIRLLVDPSATTISQGEKAYMIPAATSTTGGMLTNSASGNDFVGYFLSDWADRETDPENEPAGDYLPVYWKNA